MDDIIKELDMFRSMPHWKCTNCHHEWDGHTHPTCDWCGSDGRILTPKKDTKNV